MKVFAIIFGCVAISMAVIAQLTGFGEGMPGAVYHHIWWSVCGGFAIAAGISMP